MLDIERLGYSIPALPMTELHTPREWAEIYGFVILDPDGWRVDDKDFDAPISMDEFNQRVALSTCQFQQFGGQL